MPEDDSTPFVVALAFADDPHNAGGILYRLDYLPRKEFDRHLDRYGSALFQRSPALRLGKTMHNMLHAIVADSEARRTAEEIGQASALVRCQGNAEMALRFGESRMIRPIRILRGEIATVRRGVWPVKRFDVVTHSE